MSNSVSLVSKDIEKFMALSNEYCCVINADLKLVVTNQIFDRGLNRQSQETIQDFIPLNSDQREFEHIAQQSFTNEKEFKIALTCSDGAEEKLIEWRLNRHDGLIFCIGNEFEIKSDLERTKLIKALDQLNAVLDTEQEFSENQITDIQRVLSEKVDKFKLISQNVSDIVCLHEPKEARYLYVSPSLKDVTGYEPNEFVGKSPYDFFHPDMQKMLEEDHKRKQEGEDVPDEGPPPKMLYKILAKDGGYIWLESHTKPIFDDAGNVIMILSTSRDVTERVDAEQEKEKFFEYYRILGNNIPNGAIFLVDKDYRFLIAEGQEFKKLDRTPEFYLNKTIFEVYDKERLSFLQPYFEKVIAHKSKVKFEYIHQGYDYTFLGTPCLDNNGDIVCGIFLTQNITESKETERKLRDSIHELEFQKSALDAAALVSITDINGKIIYVNDKFCNISGYSENELIGQAHEILRSEFHTDDFMSSMSDTMKRGELWHGEIKNKSKSGEFFWVDTYVIPFKDEAGNVIRYVYIRFDITDRKRIEEDLKARNFELDAFAYHTSHDLRAPLSSIIGLTKLIEMETDVENMKSYNSLIESSVQKLDNFIWSVMTHSQNKNLDDKIIDLDFNNLIKYCLDEIKYHKNFDRIDVKVNVRGKGKFFSDKMRVAIILKNIISNAVKYVNINRDDSKISIDVEYSTTVAKISIDDNGIGIRKKYLNNVFEMFYKANDREEGSGLGLYIVKQTVDRLKGMIDIESEYGEGTRVTLSLPSLK